jgi:hypothetical protein
VEGQHRLVDVGALLLPEDHPVHGEAVPQVVDARPIMGAAIDPAQAAAQRVEHPVHLALAQRLAEQPAASAHKERRLRCRGDEAMAQISIARQGLNRARMQRQLARFGELSAPHAEQAQRQIHI